MKGGGRDTRGFSPRQWQHGAWACFELLALAIDAAKSAGSDALASRIGGGTALFRVGVCALSQCLPCDPCRLFLAQVLATFPRLEECAASTASAVEFVYDLKAGVASKIDATRVRRRAGVASAGDGSLAALEGFASYPERVGFARRVRGLGPMCPPDGIADFLAMCARRVGDAERGSVHRVAKMGGFVLLCWSLRGACGALGGPWAALSRALESGLRLLAGARGKGSCEMRALACALAVRCALRGTPLSKLPLLASEFERHGGVSWLKELDLLRGPASLGEAE